ncbi:MAG: hypothetical protein ND866_28595 [Pyrinomonadaceae bacterium]|nr:hypothetical protein [Pyrinomonadaceae bacterium]
MQISGHAKPDTTDPLLSEEKWVYAPTELRHAERVKRAIAARGLTDVVDVLFVLSVIDNHGLFHQPIPAPKQRSKDIRRAATAASNRLRRRMRGIRAGKISAADARERRLAEEWPRLGQAALKMEEEKIRCATYQTLRGGRIVPVGASANRRPERELTHALLLIDCHLDHGKDWPKARRIACLTAIVIGLQDLREDASIVAARVRERLREAKKHEALQIWQGEYLDALSAVGIPAETEERLARKQQFDDLMRTLYSSECSEAAEEEVAARLGPSFHVS